MNRKEFKRLLDERVLVLDGGYGTEFFKKGFGDITGDLLNIDHKETVLELQQQYVNAGADILLTNTFNSNPLKLKKLGIQHPYEIIIEKAVEIARKAAKSKALVFGDISSTGDFIVPFGNNDFETVVNNYSLQAKVLLDNGVDGFIVETMSDLKELKAVILGVRNINTDLPLIVQMTFEENERSVTGTTPAIFAALMEDLDVDVLGVNCSTGPEKMLDVVKHLSKNTTKYISVEPNAGTPYYDGKQVTYKMSSQKFAYFASQFAELGANIIGGCCGTTPLHIKAIKSVVGNLKPKKRISNLKQYLTSRTEIIDTSPFMIIGERINPASKSKWQENISNFNFSKIIFEANKQKTEGSKVLDINFGIEKILAENHFRKLIQQLDKHSTLPLSLDIQTNRYLKSAHREYPGRALLNSARVTPKSLERKTKLLSENGGMLILLAMDKKIPKSVDDRVKLIKLGVEELEKKGINRNRIFADALVLSFGAGNDPKVTLSTLEKLQEMNIKTVVGLSNLSFGMPNRSLLNGAFISQAVSKGLTAAIMNSGDEFVVKSLYGSLSLTGQSLYQKTDKESKEPILNAILSGAKNELIRLVESKLEQNEPIFVSQEILGKEMEEVGNLFAKSKIYLPQLLLAAETVQPAFDYITERFPDSQNKKGTILLATVEGDIHDIGKKIIGTVLHSNGFEIIDLGQDIPAIEVIEQVEIHEPDILGLSAMMTTTVDEIGKVSKLLKKRSLKTSIIAGGASMNKELAKRYNIDGYCKNAADVVDLCNNITADQLETV